MTKAWRVYKNGKDMGIVETNYDWAVKYYASKTTQNTRYKLVPYDFSDTVPNRQKNPRPRLGTKKPTRASSATGRAPTKRLVKRRKTNTRKGYFPNPREIAAAYVPTRQRAKILNKIEKRAREKFRYSVQEKHGIAWKTVAASDNRDAMIRYAKIHANHTHKQVRVFEQ